MYLLKWLSERRTAVKLIQDPIQQSSGLLFDDCKWSGFKFVGNRTVSVIDFWTDCFHVIESRECIMVNNLINSLNYFLEFMNPVSWHLKVKQEFGDNFTVFVSNPLPEVSTLPSLVASSLVKGSFWLRDQRIM